MKPSSEKTCPECGMANRPHALQCRQCGAPLVADWQQRPRLRHRMLRRTDFLAASRANQRATRRLVAILLAILAVLGYLSGWGLQLLTGPFTPETVPVRFFSGWGLAGAIGLLLLGVLWSWVSFRSGDRIILHMAGARPVTAAEEPLLHNVVEEMAIAAGIRKPRVCVIETDALNAFATGMTPVRATIGVTRGLLNALDREELQGVIGHETGHIVNWDIRYATAVGVLVGLIALVSDGALRTLRYSGGRSRSGGRGGGAVVIILFLLLFAALAPLFSRLVQMAVSRQREFLADATSVRLTRHPEGLIAALEKLAASARPFDGANRATQHMFIVNPFRNFSASASRLFATHPPLELRIARLRNLGGD